MSRWKAFERRCAAKLGGHRRPVTGITRGDGDAYTKIFECQIKLRRGMPSYLREWLDGITATARARDRIGVVIWKTPGRGRPDDDAIVLMRFADFIDLHGEVPAAGLEEK